MNPRHPPRPMPKAVFVSPVCGKAKEKAELFCKERLWKDISRSDGKDSTRSTRKKGRSGTDHQRVWDTAEDEPEYPGWSFV